MKTQLTVQQAIAEGFTHYGFDGEEYNHRIDKIEPYYFPDGALLVDKDNHYPFTISAESIEEWVCETLIGEQDEVSDPDGELSVLAADADFQRLADDINERMSKIKYRDLTDIELIP